MRDRVRTPPGNRTPPMGFGNPARRQPEQCMDVALRRRMRASVVVPLEGLEPSPATFVASCPILGTVADVRGLLTAFVRVVAGKAPPRAVTGSRRRWRPHRRGQARRPLTRTGHLRGGAPGASLTRSPECRYLRPVIVTVTDVYRPERSASPPIIARSGGIEPTISGWRDRRTDHCPTSAREGLATNLPEIRGPGGTRTRNQPVNNRTLDHRAADPDRLWRLGLHGRMRVERSARGESLPTSCARSR